jgi:hypothetical protein
LIASGRAGADVVGTDVVGAEATVTVEVVSVLADVTVGAVSPPDPSPHAVNTSADVMSAVAVRRIRAVLPGTARVCNRAGRTQLLQ